ncbi:MAG: CBS domain-containing protein [Saprospiraceae bacterium]|nr:CBS domain-containing protein [Saprospiraceae bacterium]MBK7789070.1 CBS domain-containing protein [Saprospiraceae bacterium]MBK8849711.1 CBS domain-containing protein [Saprospiraceae bacterium]MBK9689564.1 CBS domain-containing protein [Saprospiraceae bacterium]MBL0083582.1 CBS domain-containing protein [Saprospiraceae bacterium]
MSDLLGPLKTSDTGEEAINIMHVYHVKHLPIVDNHELEGLISEDDILNHDLDKAIGTYKLSLVNPFCHEGDHLFEVMQKMALNKLTTIPVIDSTNRYLGLVTIEDVFNFFGDSYAFKEPGSIIILETDRSKYSLSEIARICESEGILIFSSFVTSNLDSTSLYVTLKLNTFDVTRLVNAFQRYDYTVSGAFAEDEYIDTLRERYQSLMNFLSI